MRHSLLTISALFFFTFSSTASEQSRIEELHNQAYQLLDTDLDAAMALADSSLLLAQEAGLSWEEANSYYIKGYIYRQKNELSKGFLMYLHSLRILSSVETDRAHKTQVEVLLNCGVILRKYSKYNEAVELYNKALQIASDLGLKKRRVELLNNKASALREKGELQSSLEVVKKAITLANELGNSRLMIRSFNLLGLVHKDGEHYEEAREYYQYILNHEKTSQKDRARAYHNIATTYVKEDNQEAAKKYLDQALTLKRQIDNSSLLFTTLYDLAEWHLGQGNLVQASSCANEAESLYVSLFREPEIFDIFYLQGNILETKEELRKAKDYSDKAYEESLTFIQEQEAIIKQLKQFQMDLIMAGFEAEQIANEQQSKVALYRWLALVGGILVILVWIGWKTWFNNHRRQLGRKVKTIMNEFEPKL